jgi:hypothetical protein
MNDMKPKTSQWIDNRLFFYEELPPGFKNWLEFYDNIPVEHREAETVQYLRFYDAPDVMGLFGVVPIHREPQVQVVHSVRREYMLARVAEVLLPARLSKDDLDAIYLKFRVLDIPDYSMAHVDSILGKLQAIATPQ